MILGRDIQGCSCATSWCDLDLTFDLAFVTLTLQTLSELYLRNCKAYKEVGNWQGHWLGGVGMHRHGVTFNLGSTKVC